MNYTQKIVITVRPEVIFKAITQQLNDWWGKTDSAVAKVGDEFTTSFGNAFWKFKILEYMPNEILTWLCVDGKPEFNAEWIGTTINWNISLVEGKTELSFTHDGLTPEFKCYDICAPTWDMFITSSLKSFIETGIGKPHQS
jgi:Activator of Hsp90 ATPase homolog 1-like protein